MVAPVFEILCAGLIAMVFGMLLAFAGYRLFLFLLPLWGFFFGLYLGAQSMQALFGEGFFATITSWVVGFVVGAIFAVLSYLFYIVAVAILAGSLGYGAAVAILLAIGMDMGFLLWLIGIVAGAALIFVTLKFNLQKWVIIIATSVAGAAVVFGGFFMMFNPWSKLLENPLKEFFAASPFLLILAIVLAIAGFVVQYRQNRNWTLEAYSNWE
jgi:hypothetical protein